MGLLTMSEQERLRKSVFEMVKKGHLKLIQASAQCALSYRQTQRVYARYLEEGDAGLIHVGRGKKSNRKHPHREEIIAKYKERYEGFGPTLAAEKLAEEDGLIVDHDILRKWLLDENLWHRARKRSPHRQRREPSAQFGELLQLDGSIHDWFENGTHACLMNLVDDATTKTLARLEPEETTAGVFRVLYAWIKRHGIPLALYVDLKTVELLANNFVDKLNEKFEKIPKKPASAHRRLDDLDLEQILCWEYGREVQNDWTFSFMNQCYQIEKPCVVKAKAKIIVRRHLDTSVSAWYNGERLKITAIEKAKKVAEKTVSTHKMTFSERGKLGGAIGKSRSPWGRFNPYWLHPETAI